MAFSGLDLEKARKKAGHVESLRQSKIAARVKLFGSPIQPIPTVENGDRGKQ